MDGEVGVKLGGGFSTRDLPMDVIKTFPPTLRDTPLPLKEACNKEKKIADTVGCSERNQFIKNLFFFS